MAPAGQINNHRLAYLYTAPAFIIMGMVIAFPFLYNVVVSLSNMNLSHFRDWHITGISNYVAVMADSQFWYYFMKTILWTIINLVFHIAIGIGLAILLDKDIRGRTFFRIALILPWAVPQYITALTWRGMFNSEYGSIPLMLSKWFGVNFSWLNTEWGAFSACLIANIWLGFPFMMIVALGGLQSIPQELYEAAEIDGASWYNKLRNVTLPLLKPVMIPAVTLGVIWTFNNFNVVWLVSNGGEPSDRTHILVSWVYKAAFTYFRMGYAAAFSMVIFAILFIFGWQFMKRTQAAESVY